MDNTILSESRHYNRILSEIDEVYHELALKQGFSDSAMSILYILADNDGTCRITDLIRQCGLNKQTAHSALRKLEREGILFLEPADGKSKRVCLTEQGTQIVHNTVDNIIAAENKIYSSWERQEWELYLQLTQRYLHQLREEMKEILEK